MFALGPLILVAVVVFVYALTRARPGAPPPTPPPPPRPGAQSPSSARRDELAGWVAAGLLSEEQAAAIEAHERAHRWAAPAPPQPGAPAPVSAPRPRRVSAVAEALGYLGGALTTIGLCLLVGRSWPDMATAVRLALSGSAAVALVVGGALVREQTNPALARLRWVLWLASTAAAALFAGVVGADALDLGRNAVVLLCAGTVTVESGLLWWWRPRPLQQLTCIAGFAVFVGALVSLLGVDGAIGLAVWPVGATYLALGLRRRTPLPLLSEGVGAVTTVVAAGIVAASWQAVGLPLVVATSFGLLAVATVPGLTSVRADMVLCGVVGGWTLVQSVPGTLAYFAAHGGAAAGGATWLVGALLVFLGARRLVRIPLVVQAVGAVALIGGAALTVVQWRGFAPLFGIVTAVGLVALGMLPGQVLLSVFGSLGLLINVPWAIGWFFPGEGRAPLLIMVSGALVLAVAVTMARMGGRFRSDLGGSHRRPPSPPAGVMPRPSH